MIRSHIIALSCLLPIPLVLAESVQTLDAINSAILHSSATGTYFSVTGQIGLICAGTPNRICVLDTEHESIASFWDAASHPAHYEVGDHVRIEGSLRCDLNAANREIPHSISPCFTNLTVLGNSALPSCARATAIQFSASPSPDHCFVEVGGIVSSVSRDETNEGWNWIILRTGQGKIRVAATEHDYPYGRLRKLIDAYVFLHGCITPFVSWRKFLGQHLVLFGKDGIVQTEQPPAPFEVPDLRSEYFHHRQKIRGRIVGHGPHALFIYDDSGHFFQVTPLESENLPDIGDYVTVSGFAELGPMGLQLTGAIIRRESLPSAPPISPLSPNPDMMFNSANGQTIVDSELYGKIIRLRGRIASSRESVETEGKFQLTCGQHMIAVEVDHLKDILQENIVRDCIVDVTGVCIGKFSSDVIHADFPKFEGFLLVPRFANDITIIKGPPWWTPFRLFCVIAVLVIALIVILIWNHALSVLSERRGRDLYRERITSARAKIKVNERTHLAVELHDSISQTLTGVALQIDSAALESEALATHTITALLTTARQMLTSCRQELRCCLWDLRSRTFEERDLSEAIRRTLAPYLGSVKALIRFNVQRDRLSDTETHTILRIVRELAVNAIRHGKATEIRIAGEFHEGVVRFVVRDNGCGFNPDTVEGPEHGHFGLQGVRERAEEYEGSVSLVSSPGHGTSISVSLNNQGVNHVS